MFTHIIPVRRNIQINNGSKAPVKGFGLFIIKIPKTIIIPLWTSLYMTQKPQNTISQTTLRHYNKFRSVRTDSIIWLKITRHMNETQS